MRKSSAKKIGSAAESDISASFASASSAGSWSNSFALADSSAIGATTIGSSTVSSAAIAATIANLRIPTGDKLLLGAVDAAVASGGGTSPTASAGAAAELPAQNGTLSTITAVAASGDALIDGLLRGNKWAGSITYSDPDAATDYQAGYSSDQNFDGISAQNQGFSQFNAMQMKALHSALNQDLYTQDFGAGSLAVEGFTNLNISYGISGDGNSTIRAANSSDADTAYAFYPSNSIYGGDAFFGNAYDGTSSSLKTPVAGNYGWHTIIHEMGHSLGLKHSQETGGVANVAVPTAYDDIEFTVMSYRSYIGAPLTGYSYEEWGAPQTYMMLDIQALQYMYGADYTVNSGNTTYTWNPDSGNTVIDGQIAIAPGGNRIFATLWDGGGTDTYDLSAYSTNLSLDLRPGGYSLFSSAQQANLGNFNYARGNIFNAMLFNGNEASLIENAIGGSGNDTIIGNNANNVLTGNDGADYLNGGNGDDTLEGGAGADNLAGESGNDILNGGAGVDIIDGGEDVDTIHGGDDSDIIYGGFSTDEVYGDAGDDTFIIRQSVIGTEFGDNTYGGSGIDKLDLSQIVNTYGATVDLSLGTWQYNPLYGGPWVIDGVENVSGTQLDDIITGSTADNVLSGNDGNDRISGGDGNDTLNGGNGNDRLIGGAGNDTFDGGSGVDLAYGEAGDDTFKIVNGWDGGYGEIFVGGGGSDTLDVSAVIGFSSTTVNLADGTFNYLPGGSAFLTLSSVENFIGSSAADSITGSGEANTLVGANGADTIYGLGGNDNLSGGAGSDILDGGIGDDVMTGGDDNDTYYVDSSADNVVEGLTGGTADIIYASVSYTLIARHVETLVLTGVADINASGNTRANTLIGNSGNNVLSGAEGNDVLDGGAGNDTLNGGLDTDTATYASASSPVTVSLAVAGAQATGGAGTDTLISIENLIGSSFGDTLTGSAANNVIEGGLGNDIIDGGLGNDTLSGGDDNDTYYVDSSTDNVVEGLTGGTADIVFASASYSLVGRYVETLTLTGVANINATGNSQVNILNGNSGNNTLSGGIGNDVLNGGAGNDTLDGGSEIDTASYAGASGPVTVSLAIAGAQATGGAGTDTLIGIENLTGSSFNDTLTGSVGNNLIDGGLGNDTMSGGDGNDTYLVDSSTDNVVEGSTGGTADVIFASVTYTLAGRFVETLALTGTANIDAIGNNQANTLVGNDGNNTLSGSLGNDFLEGGLGNDTLTGGGQADTFSFRSALGSTNIDTITDFVVVDDTIRIANSIFTGLAAGTLSAAAFFIGAAANDADDRIIYNSATGALFFDSDGTGGNAAIQFATLSAGLALTNADFFVV